MVDILETGLQISVPHTKPFYGPFIRSLWSCAKPPSPDWEDTPGLAVDVARNHLTQKFLDNPKKPRFMLFIDNDATWSRNAIVRLMRHDLPVVTATIYSRILPPTPPIGRFIGKKPDGTPVYQFQKALEKVLALRDKHDLWDLSKVDNAMELPLDDDTLSEEDGCGMHFCMIRRDVIEKVPPPWFVMGSKGKAGEDFYFCRKAREAGFPIYWDTGLHTGHLVGETADFGLREFLAFATYVDHKYLTQEGFGFTEV